VVNSDHFQAPFKNVSESELQTHKRQICLLLLQVKCVTR